MPPGSRTVPSDARTLAELLGTVSLCPSSKGSEMAVIGLTHININCSDYERSKAFYELLGFREFWQVPETNRAEIAAAVGMAPYRVRGALLKLETDESGGVPLTIDLLQWIDPHDDAAPRRNRARVRRERDGAYLKNSDLLTRRRCRDLSEQAD